MTLLPEVQNHYGKLKLYINGKWVDSHSDRIYESVNPANGKVIAEFPSATDDEIEEARIPSEELHGQGGFPGGRARVPLMNMRIEDLRCVTHVTHYSSTLTGKRSK